MRLIGGTNSTNPPSYVGDGIPLIMGSFKRSPLMSRAVAERKGVGVDEGDVRGGFQFRCV
jgi:hypothetical protein